MEYYYEFQDWLYRTSFYQEILKELPVPLNNIYFDSIMLLVLGAYLIYRILDAIWYACRRRHIRKRQEKERKQQMQREKEMMYRELQVQQKEEKVGRFLDYMEMLAARQSGQTEYYEYQDGREYQSIQGHRRKRLGLKQFFLEKKDKGSITGGGREGNSTDYDTVMDAYVYDVEQEQKISKRQELEKEQLHSNIHALDDELRVRVVEDSTESVNYVDDPALERRKKKARLKAEKEKRKAEKRLSKAQKKGGKHGGFGK